DFQELVRLSSAFRDFALRGVSSLLDQVNQQAKRQAREAMGEMYSMETPLNRLALRNPVACEGATPIRSAVRRMHEASVGSIVVTDADAVPQGIFTLRDLRQLVAEGEMDLQQPISCVMTPSPCCLPVNATAFDAAIAMTREDIGHICVTPGKPLGRAVSTWCLFWVLRGSLRD